MTGMGHFDFSFKCVNMRGLRLFLFLCLIGSYSRNAFAGKADDKCEEYTQAIKNIIGTNPVPDIPNVGVPVLSPLGKVEALPAEFPHMAHLGFLDHKKIVWLCGGFLISDQYVMTAVRCARNIGGNVKYIRLGATDQKTADTSDRNVQLYIPEQIIIHPEWKSDEKYYDIALIKLDKKVIFTKHVLPACLQTDNNTIDQNFVATGWGLTEYHGNASDTLMKVSLELFTLDECREKFKPMRTLQKGITDDMLCAGGHTESRDTCQGDSGGPVQTYKSKNPNIYKVAGIISFGKACGIVGYPGVSTRISSYIPWVESNVWP